MKKTVFVLIAILVVISAIGTVRYYKYPHGYRNCCLPCMMSLLVHYSIDHTNDFPAKGETPLDALSELYPNYTADGGILAGISGDIGATCDHLKKRSRLTSQESSWIYFPGFRGDETNDIAIIWERAEGITLNGERCDGHAVGFVDGSYRQIASRDWDTFLNEQQRLRDRVKKNATSPP